MSAFPEIGIVGMGDWGNYLLEKALATNGLSVRAVCARRHSDVKVGGRFIVVNDDNVMATDDRLAGVIIATQPETHWEVAAKFLQRGKKVLIEKPLASNVRDAARLVALSRARGSGNLMVGDKYLYAPAISALKAFIERKGIVIRAISCRWLKRSRVPKCGVFLDLCYHHLYLFQYLLGRAFEKVEKRATNCSDGVTTAGVVIAHCGGVLCLSEVSCQNHVDYFEHSMRIETDQGTFVMREAKRQLSISFDRVGAKGARFEYRENRDRTVEGELQFFGRWLTGKAKLLRDPAQDLDTMRVLCCR
jgi:predicted dehydrogenase